MIADVTGGIRMNSLVDVREVLQEIQRTDKFKQDLIAHRGLVRFNPSSNGIEIAFDANFATEAFLGPFMPTKTGLEQLAHASGIPKGFLLETERKYPELASDMLSHWFLDNDACNKHRKKPVPATGLKQLFRCYKPFTKGEPGILRAVRSDRYKILDNSDLAACVLSAVSKFGKDATIEVRGSITDDKLYLIITDWSEKKAINVGDEVCFRVRISNSETGYSSLSITPQVVILSCLNGATVGKNLVKMHLGEKQTYEDLLSQKTHDLKNKAFFAEVQDVISACFEKEHHERIIELLNRNANQGLTDPIIAVESVCKKFSIDEATKQLIFADFLGNESYTRFDLSQSCTTVAHVFEKKEYEKTAHLEDVGGKILTMSEREFARLPI